VPSKSRINSGIAGHPAFDQRCGCRLYMFVRLRTSEQSTDGNCRVRSPSRRRSAPGWYPLWRS